MYSVAEALGAQPARHYLDQFGRAASVSQPGSECCFYSEARTQLDLDPSWVVAGVGTGGTSSGVGHYRRTHHTSTRLAAVDPEGSVFAEAWQTGRKDLESAGSRIEGIGRPRVETSFTPEVIDAMLPVPDATSLAAMDLLAEVGRPSGPSTGTNLAGALERISQMRLKGERGVVLTLRCDHQSRYTLAHADPDWREREGIEISAARRQLEDFLTDRVGTPY